MSQLRLCIFSQTPLVRFVRDPPVPEAAVLPLSAYAEGPDYLPSPGGVTRMVQAFLRRARERGRLRSATWMALASHGPDAVRLSSDATFEQVRLASEARREYAQAKSAVWDAVHELPRDAPLPDVPRGLDHLAGAMATRASRLHAAEPFDAFYVHDFQLLPLGEMLPRGVPRVFRWHIPVAGLDRSLRRYVARKLDTYDSVIVSTHGYAETLRSWGVQTPVHASYPYLDESRARVVTPDRVAAFDARYGLHEDDVVFLVVARLDPMKRQDLAIRALARIAKDEPRAKLLLVGGGGFSGGRKGLGLPAAARWRSRLENEARALGVADRVVMTGSVSDEALDVAYTRARAILLPSAVEGFGLAAVEGWLYSKPVVVSDTCGVAELVEDGANGFRFPAGDDARLAMRMQALARDPELSAELGAAGRAGASACHVRYGADHVWSILREAVASRAQTRREASRW